MTDSPLHLAVDVGPLHGHRTGVAVAVDGVVGALRARSDVELQPYLVSFRSLPVGGELRLPLPGIAASHLWSRLGLPRADRWLRGADVVHGTNYVAPPTRLPTVVSVYDCWFLHHPEEAAPIVRRAGRILRRAVAAGAWIHASSEATAAMAGELLATERVETIHLGPPSPPPPLADLARPAIAEQIAGRPFVVAIGTEERRKDLPLLVAAFGQFAARQPDVMLVLAGTAGDDTDAVTGAIGGLPPAVRDRVHRIGPVDESTKHWLLRLASALAYPSHDEGFGFPVLEGQLAGTPVVARAVGSIPEIAGEGAELVTERDPEAFAAGLERVLTSGPTRLGLIEAGHRNVRRFAWDATADRLVALYRRAQGAA